MTKVLCNALIIPPDVFALADSSALALRMYKPCLRV